MHTIRYPKVTHSVAFFIGALLVLLIAAPARSAEPFQLDRIGVVRFTPKGTGTLRRQNAVLHADGRVNLRGAFTVPRPANAPAWVLGHNLISVEAWLAYHSLGTGSLQQFELHDGGARVYSGDEAFLLEVYSVPPGLVEIQPAGS